MDALVAPKSLLRFTAFISHPALFSPSFTGVLNYAAFRPGVELQRADAEVRSPRPRRAEWQLRDHHLGLMLDADEV